MNLPIYTAYAALGLNPPFTNPHLPEMYRIYKRSCENSLQEGWAVQRGRVQGRRMAL